MAAAAVLVVALAHAVAAADDDRNLPPGSPPLRMFLAYDSYPL